MKIRVALIAVLFAAVGLRLSPVHADQGGIPAQVAALQQAVQTLQQQDGAQNTAIARLKGVVNAQTVVITQLQQQIQALQIKTGDAILARLELESVPSSGGDPPTTPILSLPGFVDVLMYCSSDVSFPYSRPGGFVFLNTTSEPLRMNGELVQPGQSSFNKSGISSSEIVATFFSMTVTSDFDHPYRVAKMTLSGYVQATVCRAQVTAGAQP